MVILKLIKLISQKIEKLTPEIPIVSEETSSKNQNRKFKNFLVN